MTEKRDKIKFPSSSDEIDLSGEQLKRWVVNLSKREMSSEENSILAKGLNFAVTENKHPVKELIVAAEKACSLLNEEEASVLRPKLVSILTSAKPPKSNVSDEQTKALKSLAKDDTIMILPADKGRATVILDKETYKEKVMVMLSDEKTYTRLDKDPTAKYKRKLVNILARLKSENNITDAQKRYVYPTSESMPRLYCAPKIH